MSLQWQEVSHCSRTEERENGSREMKREREEREKEPSRYLSQRVECKMQASSSVTYEVYICITCSIESLYIVDGSLYRENRVVPPPVAYCRQYSTVILLHGTTLLRTREIIYRNAVSIELSRKIERPMFHGAYSTPPE